MLCIPISCPVVQFGKLVCTLGRQPLTQKIGKEWVKAVPLALVIQRHDEQVGDIHELQDLLTLARQAHLLTSVQPIHYGLA